MKKPYIPFFAFLVLLVLTIPFSFDFATSVVPGWHTTIFPPYFIWEFTVLIIMIFVTIGYWLLSKRVGRINRKLFVFHFVLTIPTLILLRFPSIFSGLNQASQEAMIKTISLQVKLIPVAWVLFFAGQILFMVYFLSTVSSKKSGM